MTSVFLFEIAHILPFVLLSPPVQLTQWASIHHYTKIQTTMLVKRNELWIKNFLWSPWNRQVKFEGSRLLIMRMLCCVQSRHPSFRGAIKISDLQLRFFWQHFRYIMHMTYNKGSGLLLWEWANGKHQVAPMVCSSTDISIIDPAKS